MFVYKRHTHFINQIQFVCFTYFQLKEMKLNVIDFHLQFTRFYSDVHFLMCSFESDFSKISTKINCVTGAHSYRAPRDYVWDKLSNFDAIRFDYCKENNFPSLQNLSMFRQ